jgi:general secretion pathway protein H
MDLHLLPLSPRGRGQRERGTTRARCTLGFTLVEILVVVFILAAVMGMVTLRLTRDDRDLVRDEADRLVLLLQAAREEVILQGGLLAFELDRDGYRFLQPGEKGKWTPIGNGTLAPRQFPPRMTVRLELEGQQTVGRQLMPLEPSGMLPGFNIVFNLNDARWWVVGGQDGKIRSVPTLDTRPS